jgi:hypothetical protein
LNLGGVNVILLFVAYSIGVDFILNSWWGFVDFFVPLFLLIYLSIEYKKIVGGFITFKATFFLTFGLLIASGFIATFFSVLLYNFIDVDFAVLLQEATIEKTMELLESLGSESMMEESIEALESQNNYSTKNLATGYLLGLPFQAILALIISAFLKKDKSEIE